MVGRDVPVCSLRPAASVMRDQGGGMTVRELKKARDIPALLAALQSPNEMPPGRVIGGETFHATVRGEAAVALGQLGVREAVDQITPLLRDRHSTVRGQAARALGDIGDSSAAATLRASLSDESPSVRIWAARSSAKLDDQRAVEHLIEILSDENPVARAEAAEALAKLGDPSALPAIEEAAGLERRFRFRRRIRKALGSLLNATR